MKRQHVFKTVYSVFHNFMTIFEFRLKYMNEAICIYILFYQLMIYKRLMHKPVQTQLYRNVTV